MSSIDPRSFPDDEQNPYAPPRTEVTPELPLDAITPMSFSLGDVLTRSWQIYRDRMGNCIGVVVGCWGMNVLAQLVLQATQAAAPLARNPQAVAAIIGLIGTLALVLFQAWINIGQTIVMLEIARGKEAPFGDVFRGSPYLLRVVVAGFLLGMGTLGVFGLGAAPGGLVWSALGRDAIPGPIALALGLFVASVVWVVLALRLSQFYYLIIDRNVGILDSFRLSIEITRGKAGLIFMIGLLTIPINIAGLLACFVGLFFTMPFTVLLFTVTYLALTGQPTADPYGKGEPMPELEPL